jgi:hypothetical protein
MFDWLFGLFSEDGEGIIKTLTDSNIMIIILDE